MDYEKEYKKLKAGISKAYLYAQTDSTKAVLENILPELTENEDERTRRSLIDAIKIGYSNNGISFTKEAADRYIAWLEKQEENTWSEEDDAKVKVMCEEGDLKPSERAWLKDLKNRVWKEQKPAEWSKEDEEHLKSIISTIEMCMKDCEDANAVLGYYDSDISWLKSLRPQSKAELTLLDENIIDAAITFVEQNNHFSFWGGIDKHTVIKALRSLKSKWKPTDEQMEALKNSAYGSYQNGDGPVLRGLYEQLLKLGVK